MPTVTDADVVLGYLDREALLGGGLRIDLAASERAIDAAIEAVIAAMEQDKTALMKEAADVLYHLLVLMRAGGVSLDEVMDELQRRTAQSGHQEKASRGT